MKLFSLIFLLFSAQVFAAKPPKEIITQMVTMASVEAALGVCFASTEYKNLPATEALKFHDISIKITDIIELIQKRYDDDILYLAFMLESQSIGDSLEFKRYFAKTYSRQCAQQLLIDSTETINSVRTRVNIQIKKK
jgi:hypothetical protein